MMAEIFDPRAHHANTQPGLSHSISKTGSGLIPALIGAVRNGIKTLRMYAVMCFVVLLFPLLFALTKDWICVLVVFQASLAAVRLQNAPAARIISSSTPHELAGKQSNGEYRAL